MLEKSPRVKTSVRKATTSLHRVQPRPLTFPAAAKCDLSPVVRSGESGSQGNQETVPATPSDNPAKPDDAAAKLPDGSNSSDSDLRQTAAAPEANKSAK